MKILTEDEFARRTASGRRTPVFKEFLADRETPVAALSRLREDEEAVLLESVSGGEARGRYSFLAVEPSGRIAGKDALERIDALFAANEFVPAPELPPFQGGAAGYIAYDAAGIFEPKLANKVKCESGTPPMDFLVCEKFLVFDDVRGTVTIAVVKGEGGYGEAMAEIERLCRKLLSAESIAETVRRNGEAERSAGGAVLVPEMSKDEFRAMVSQCKDAIAAGEAIQIVPSQKFSGVTRSSDLSLYRALRTINPSPYEFFMRIGRKTLIGSSPEELVKLEGRVMETSPIAGTRPRGKTAAEDAALERELKSDEKENAEHVMLVDLGRNDLGRVAETGSVKVESFARVEKFSHVMHLVSSVKGTLAENHTPSDLVKAVFPAGTLSGAPKIRAMEIIAEIEKSPRGIYGGAAGYFSFTGGMDFAIAIRTLVKEGKSVTMRAGAGITADSDPDREYDETINKSKAVFEALKEAEELQ